MDNYYKWIMRKLLVIARNKKSVLEPFRDIVLEFNNNDQLQAKFTHGPGVDEPLEMNRNNSVYFYHTDGLGSITAFTDVNGNTVQSYAYSSFGETKVYNQSGNEVNPNQMIQSPYAYTAREWDYEIGLNYHRARYYDPYTGRFLSPDPIHFKGGDANLFRYVRNNPLRYVDPSGLTTIVFTTFTFGVGSHSAIAVVNDKTGTVTIYDPGGSFNYNGEGGSGGYFEGDQQLLEEFLKYQENTSGSVDLQYFNTTEAEEKAIVDSFTGNDDKDPGPGNCAISTSEKLRNANRFKKINPTFLPGRLHDQLRRVRTM